MKRSRLLLSALSVCLALLIAFSATAYAEEITVENYRIRQDVYLISNGVQIWESFYSFTPHDGTEQKSQDVKNNIHSNVWDRDDFIQRTVWNVFRDNGFPFELNKKNYVTFDNFYFRMLVSYNNVNEYVESNSEIFGDTAEVVLTFADGTSRTFPLDTSKEILGNYDMSFTFTPTQNVTEMSIILDTHIIKHLKQKPPSDAILYITSYMGEFKGDNSHDFLIDIQTEEAGLLSGILDWVKGIYTKIGDIVVDITELPSKIWEVMSDGLTGLFVPSQEYLDDFVYRMDGMLESKLGAVYQVTHEFAEMYDKIQLTEVTQEIEVPEVSIPLPEDNDFKLGGWRFKVVPEGFEFLAETCRLIVGCVATVSTFYGLRKVYDDLMEG